MSDLTDDRIELPKSKWTKRSQLVDAVIERMGAAAFDSDADTSGGDGTYLKLFEFVGSGVLDDIKEHQTPGARIEEGEETIDEKLYSVTDKTLRLYVHFKVVNGQGIDPTPMINYYFGRIVEELVTPEHFAGIAMNIDEAGNSIQYQGQADPEPGGSVYFDVQYRHGRGNQFSETPNG